MFLSQLALLTSLSFRMRAAQSYSSGETSTKKRVQMFARHSFCGCRKAEEDVEQRQAIHPTIRKIMYSEQDGFTKRSTLRYC